MIGNNDASIAVIGLGYVGLPLAVEFGKKRPVIGFDINKDRVEELESGQDSTDEVTSRELKEAAYLTFSSNFDDLKEATTYIVTVPTPVDSHNRPDLTPLIKASEMLGGVISKGDIVIYESTVYPGATEEDCIPVIERVSGLVFNQDFYAGYSPERINPGDKERRLPDIKKVTSGSTAAVADIVDDLYRSIIVAGTHKAESIKVAEAAKIIENVQRDVNIALVNELYQIFERMGVDTNQVIEAAATKWNFMKLKPGLVGGHCIGVDPYYLLHKSQSCGYIPDLMRSAREINNNMVDALVSSFLKSIIQKEINPVGLRVLLLGFAFKEDCPDLRNTKVVDLYNALRGMGFVVSIYDPVVNAAEAMREYGVLVKDKPESADVGFLAVPHKGILDRLRANEISFDKKYCFDFRGALKA
ncbi:nucleotide sugar dehydrogenase [Dasania sp. GY-MA-18]|uniref:Nucleotide sugar dehydrogenase n=1 Tax=Dasania phycosphaerae TaxID=2950436 RepID=A0A9J6RIN8_9GAMM|nr:MULTISPECIES: nucleotide sugar dehydrogenase [Dasania]MCR8922122.1 nucleotide sugar dehydrogenase [Dasania sp. GY-MA-18]MCZ0864550.1 nucleotide sugar dehydrogenase [Dasania phycosphaerae]MCZ0868278.1 nucleotide sugar dehydrogenase [Dasania phycosphaerae]